MEFFMDGCTLYAFLREEGGTRSVTEGECVPVSLSRFILWMYRYSTAARLRQNTKSIVTRSPSVTCGDSSLPEGAITSLRILREHAGT